MTHLIDKAALVAEIERRYETNLIGAHSAFKNGKIEALREIKDLLDTLEVKEVDLDDKIHDYINTHYSEGCDGGMISDAHNDIGGVTYSDLTAIAKHFFELGLKAQKGEEV